MRLTPVTDDVFVIMLPPLRHMNAYLVGDVLVDAGLGLHARGILKAVAGRAVTAHVVTHAHGDHAHQVSQLVAAPHHHQPSCCIALAAEMMRSSSTWPRA